MIADTVEGVRPRLDYLFNNAGGPAPTGSIATVPVDGFDAAMALLVRSVMLGMKHAAPIMMKQRSGSIINNGSIAGHQTGYSTSMIYGAAKAAVNHLTRCVGMELGEHNVRVNSVSPGAIATGILAKALGVEHSQGRRDGRGHARRSTPRRSRSRAPACPTTSPSACCGWHPTAPPSSTPPISWSTAA